MNVLRSVIFRWSGFAFSRAAANSADGAATAAARKPRLVDSSRIAPSYNGLTEGTMTQSTAGTQSLPGNIPTPEHIIQTGLGFWASKTLLSAIELELFTELARHPLPLNELRGRLGLHPRSARDFFDALVALGFLNRIDGKYHNTPETDLFLDKSKPTYVGGILDMCNSRLYPFWNHLTEALRSGGRRTRPSAAVNAALCRALRRSRASQGVSARHDRSEPRREPGHRAADSRGTTTRRSWTSARRRATWPCKSRSPIRI